MAEARREEEIREQAEEEEEEESESEEEEELIRRTESSHPSQQQQPHQPSQPGPTKSPIPPPTLPCSTPFIISQFQELQTHLENILASNFSILTAKIDQLESSMNYKDDLLRTQIESLQPSTKIPAPPKKMKGIVISSPQSSFSNTFPFTKIPSPIHIPQNIPSTSQPPPPIQPENQHHTSQSSPRPQPTTEVSTPTISPNQSSPQPSNPNLQIIPHPLFSNPSMPAPSPALTEVLSSPTNTEVLEISDTSTSATSTSDTSTSDTSTSNLPIPLTS